MSKVIERFAVGDAELLDRFVVGKDREVVKAQVRAEVVNGPNDRYEFEKKSRAVLFVCTESTAGIGDNAVVAVDVLHENRAEAAGVTVVTRGGVARERERQIHARKGNNGALNEGLS